MKNVLILGARDLIAQWVVKAMADRTGTALTLLLRNARMLTGTEPANSKVVIGNVLDKRLLKSAMADQDIVYANLSGNELEKQAQSIITAMQAMGVKRLVVVLSLGIYDEGPGKFGDRNNAMIGDGLTSLRCAADAIEASDLQYTIVRPALLTGEREIDDELEAANEPFSGTVGSHKSVSDLIVKVIELPELHVGASLSINAPIGDGAKSYFT
ncbi:NAD-dependent dehydratase [Burkholderia cepacia]|uniref:NAD(P)H-binding protein n=1 Tax=Burkholderia cepacia TaxID=292 RepID=UPI00075A4A5B|nr:NAD(P)H-binding protein [Burkholderia cepacia]KWB20491.1 NAD-dependent dehydratase [Burkholderia cepacia]